MLDALQESRGVGVVVVADPAAAAAAAAAETPRPLRPQPRARPALADPPPPLSPTQARVSPVVRKATRSTHVTRAAEGDAEAKPDAFAGLKPTKASEFKAMSNDDLIAEMVSAKKMLFELRMRQSTRKEYKGHHFGILNKKIAQIRTVKREREVAEGVNKRDSRKIKREERSANIYL